MGTSSPDESLPSHYTPPMQTAWIPIRAHGVIEAEVDHQRVLMSPTDYSYFGLTGTGARVWDMIDGAISVDLMVDGLVVEYEAQPDVIRHDVLDFLSGLQSAGFLAEPK
jgi:Coenzyme PQQ synthesis protein D (PqqD)